MGTLKYSFAYMKILHLQKTIQKSSLINDTTLVLQSIWVSLNSQARVGLDNRIVLDNFVLSGRDRVCPTANTF